MTTPTVGFNTYIKTEDISVVALSKDGSNYSLFFTQFNPGEDKPDRIRIKNVPSKMLACLHMLMLMEESQLSEKLQLDLYKSIEPLLVLLADTPIRPVP